MPLIAVADLVHVSTRVPADLVAVLDRIAEITERNRSWVVIRALRQYVEGEGAQVIEDAGSLAALDRGEGVPAEGVLAELDALVDGAEDKPRR